MSTHNLSSYGEVSKIFIWILLVSRAVQTGLLAMNCPFIIIGTLKTNDRICRFAVLAQLLKALLA